MTAEHRGARRSTADLVGAALWTLLKIAFVLGILAILGLIAFGIWFQQQFPQPKGVPAPIAWTAREVVLSSESRVLEGRLTLTTGPGGNGSGVRAVGVNAGVPTEQAGGMAAELGDAFSSPAARLTATSAGETSETRSCLAPCELQLSPSFVCTAAGCEMVVGVTVELLAGPGDTDTDVTLGVAGGLTASAESRVLEGLVVDLAIEGSVPPEAT